jgi:retron-type reverse transcriptase
MPLFDTSRFLFELAGAMAAGHWSIAGLRASLERVSADRPIRVPGLYARILARFPTSPGYGPLLAFLVADAGISRALERVLWLHPVDRSRRRPAMGKPHPRLGSIDIPRLPTETALAQWLGVLPQQLRWYADVAGRNRLHPAGPLRPYRYQWLAKPSGRARLLEIPKVTLKLLQRKILAEIIDKVPAHPAAHGFCRGRSAITNAAMHCGREVVARFDLRDFFPSISAARVHRVFRTLGYPARVARFLTGLCTTRLPSDVWNSRPSPALDGSDRETRLRFVERHLPQGAPTSPALANLAAHRLDRRLSGLARRVDATYTRYADDLTFSGGFELARGAKRLAHRVAVIAGEEGFELNFRKSRVMRRGVRQKVTGVVVNVKTNTPRSEFDRLKAILTNCVQHGPAGQNRDKLPNFRAHLAGKIAHLASINPIRGRKLWAVFDRIAWSDAG